MHKASLIQGEVLPVEGMASRAVWAASRPPAMATARVNLDRWPSTSMTGTITVVQSAPVVLRFVVATRIDSDAPMRLRGDASFRRRTKSVPCFT